jgi:hypothetical protein
MLINTDLSTDSAPASLLAKRSDGGATATSSPALSNAASSQIDPSLQRLTELPASTLDADSTLDSLGAVQTAEALRKGILGQPGMALGAQANQLSQNVLSLLQSID